MKKAIILFIVGVALGGGVVWLILHNRAVAPAAADAKPAESDEEATKVTHDTNGNAVVNMTDETQGDMGIEVENPVPAQYSAEMTAFGRVQDPSALAALLSELATDQAAWTASSNDLARLKVLASQGNASTRALQAAEAAAARDELAVKSARERLELTWGKAIAGRDDLTGFLRTLVAREAVMVRVDLPAGQKLEQVPATARLSTLSGVEASGQLAGEASSVDPQMQGRGYFYLAQGSNSTLLAGEAVTGHLPLPGAPLSGVVVPRSAVVRTEGSGWVYVLQSGSDALTRTRVSLDHPVENGWFVTNGIKASDHVVTKGAQTLLSEELKASFAGGG